MGFRGPEQDDNLEIEVSSLYPALPEAGKTGSAGASNAGPLFAPKRSNPARLHRGIAVTCALLVVLVVLVLSIAPTREALRGVMLGPTPTATAPIRAGENNLYITLSPHWGSVLLDGKTLPHLPVEGIDQPLQLARGVHMLRWQFAPIIDYSCRITVPTAQDDNCPLHIGIQPGKKGIASVAAFQLSLANLVPAYRIALLTHIHTALDAEQSSEIVRPGERYLGAYSEINHDIEPVVAAGSLRATLGFVSDAENSQAQCPAIQSGPGANCLMNGDCREICTAPWQSPQDTPGAAWQAYIVAHASWRYTTLDGHVVADNQSDIGGQLQFLGSNELPAPVAIRWDGTNWNVSTAFGVQSTGELPVPVCGALWSELQYGSFGNPPSSGGWQASAVRYIPATSPAQGCLALITTPGLPTLLIMQRFGVLITANAAALSWWPMLPTADPYERQLAQRILTAPMPSVAG